MTTDTLPNGRTPAPTDNTGALDFNPKPPQNGATIHLAFQGVPVDLQVAGKTIGQIEQLIAGVLSRGWTAPPQPRGGFGGKGNELTEPERDSQGNEICPNHKTIIRAYTTKDGRTFKGCPSKATGASGEKINERGYCSLRFK